MCCVVAALPPPPSLGSVSAAPSSPSSALVSWRPLPAEKNSLSGLRLRYRAKGGGGGRWQATPPLHRDVAEYELRGLRPDTEYELRLSALGTTEGDEAEAEFRTPPEQPPKGTVS